MSEPTRRTPPRLLEVLGVEELSPHVRRVSLGGPALSGLVSWPAAHIKLFFPRAHQREPSLPTLDRDGRPVWPALSERPVTRTYSVRRHDPAAGRLDVDFVLHAPHGPASAWAAQARAGMRIGLAGPGGPRPLLKPAQRYVLAGDLSALPALGALLEALPLHAHGAAFVQIPEEADMQVLSAPPGVTITWLIRDARGQRDGDLVAAVTEAPLGLGDAFVWLAGEGNQVVALRDLLLARGVPAARMYAVPYWKRSQSEEQYHAERHRVMDELGSEGAA
jgi:NADPH-dependent ferric siderophore reductase